MRSIQDMMELARNRGIEFLSQEYVGMSRLHRWRCHRGHEWSARPANIQSRTGCPTCYNLYGRMGRSLEEAKLMASARGIKLLSEGYFGAHKKHKWRCRDGHEWMATPNNVFVGGTGCPVCVCFRTEEKVRFIFESLFGKRFLKTRSVLDGLELDGYCEELGLAFEYNGEQHYRDHFYNDFDQWSVLQRDRRKQQECCQRGIDLISIPFTQSRNMQQLEEYIRAQLKQHVVGEVRWNDFSAGNARLRELSNEAIRRDGKLLSTAYTGSHGKHLWECNVCKTRWEATAKDVLRGSWCPNCAPNRKHSIIEVQRMAAERGLALLSSEYAGMSVKHQFRCNQCGHERMVKPSSIQQGAGCPKCSKRKPRRNRAYAAEQARLCGFELVAEDFTGVKKPHLFRCGAGHSWVTTLNAIRTGRQCPSCKKSNYGLT